MTFKHVKFEDSPTMRALEKVAKEKGLVKPETLQKNASVTKKADITPTSNLMENIFKLCAGLRSQGLEKEAVELEKNYLNYKEAQTLYETSKEKGEDLVGAAHPEGSHKLENVDADEAVFEDILDQHAKLIEVMNKKPHGKLSSASQVIGAVKLALAQAAPSVEDLKKKIEININTVLKILDRVAELAKPEGTFLSGDFDMIAGRIKDAATDLTKIDNYEVILDNLGVLKDRLSKHWFTLGLTGVSEQSWSQAEPLLNKAIQLTNAAIESKKSINQTMAMRGVSDFESQKSENTPAVSNAIKSWQTAFKAATDTLNQFSYQINSDPDNTPEDKAQALKWIGNKLQAINALNTTVENAQPQDKDNAAIAVSANLKKLTSDFGQFKQMWIA